MRRFESVAMAAARVLLKRVIEVQIVNDAWWAWAATYGGHPGTGAVLTVNVGRLGKAWFNGPEVQWYALLLHEFAHENVENHVGEAFANEIARLGAKWVDHVMKRPLH
jgi:hypothetical protein